MNKLSIIVPTYNRLDKLRNCIDAFCHQTCKPDQFEVIVVVDGSTDGTREYLENLDMPFELRFYLQPNRGQWAARNMGAKAATGECLLFMDDDMVASPALVAEHIRVQSSAEPVVGIGKITLRAEQAPDWYSHCFALAWNRRYKQLGATALGALDLYSGNVSVSRAAFLETGGFSTDLSSVEDAELGQRLQKAGIPFVYVPTAEGIHDDLKPQAKLIAESEAQGVGLFELTSRHPDVLAELAKSYHSLERAGIFILSLLFRLRIPVRFLPSTRLFLPGRYLRYPCINWCSNTRIGPVSNGQWTVSFPKIGTY